MHINIALIFFHVGKSSDNHFFIITHGVPYDSNGGFCRKIPAGMADSKRKVMGSPATFRVIEYERNPYGKDRIKPLFNDLKGGQEIGQADDSKIS